MSRTLPIIASSTPDATTDRRATTPLTDGRRTRRGGEKETKPLAEAIRQHMATRLVVNRVGPILAPMVGERVSQVLVKGPAGLELTHELTEPARPRDQNPSAKKPYPERSVQFVQF